jgi:uncharacterized protein YceK
MKCILLLALLAIIGLLLGGCASNTRSTESTQTDKQDDVTISGVISIPKDEGGTQAVPVTFTIKRTGSETREKQSESSTKPDYTAMGQAMATALQPVIAALAPTGGPSLLNLLGSIGGMATVATTGYLALKKREQLKPTKNKES